MEPLSSGKPLRDVLAAGLDVLFVGINPSLMSAARGHHFARPGNRFWPALHLAGLTPRRLRPEEDAELPRYGLGVTNIVDRPTRAAAELTAEEFRAGAAALAELVATWRPRVVAVLGITAWRVAFTAPKAVLGRQPERVGGAETWVVPNPSGLNAHHQLPDLARAYAELRPEAVHGPGASGALGGCASQRRRATGRTAMTEQPNRPDRPEEAPTPDAGRDPARPEGGRTNAEATVDEDLGAQGTPSA